MTDEAPDQTMEFMCTRCNASFMVCSCPREWLENRARWIAAEAEIARLREEVASLQRERDEAREGEMRALSDPSCCRAVAASVTAQRDEARTSLATALAERDEARGEVTRHIEAFARTDAGRERAKAEALARRLVDADIIIERVTAERDALAVRVREAEAREKFCHEMLDTNHGWGPGEHLHARVSQVLAELREAQGGQGGMSGGDREALRDVWLYFAGGGHQTDGVKWRDALLRVITGGTPVAAPRTVTREWVEKWAETCAISEDMEWAGEAWDSIVTRMLADLGLQVEGDQGKETP